MAIAADNAFLQANFDAADYLNSTLPTLAVVSSTSKNAQYGRSVPLAELNAQLQSQLSQLNAQTTRLSNSLSQLTDEILRSGSRLAYEVEVLRGDTNGLSDALDHGLKEDVEMFAATQTGNTTAGETESTTPEPDHLEKLRTLTAVRSRLDAVIKVFGDAMAWPVAPSELSSSLISVSAPESDADIRSREEKGREYAENLRNEINDMIGSDLNGLDAAATRISELSHLAEVWKGTAEEKARFKLVESLEKPVERALDRTGQSSRSHGIPSATGGVDYRYGNLDGQGFGFLSNLRKLKEDMYLD